MTKFQGIRIKCPAKINLGLEILGKREDGYHIIETLFQTIDLYDELSISPADSGVHLSSNKKGMKTGKDNLIWKAATILLDHTASGKGVNIYLNKRIPIGAGLGGGSSDAAATLKGLIKLFGISISHKELHQMAITLGADIPFFLDGPIAFGHGIGDTLEKSPPLPPFWVVVAKPGFSISTAWAYSKFNNKLTNKGNKIKILRLAIESSDSQRIGKVLFNDLESVCLTKYPVLLDLKRELLSLGACGALMTGSGSAIFGLFFNHKTAHNAWKTISEILRPGGEVFLCRTIH